MTAYYKSVNGTWVVRDLGHVYEVVFAPTEGQKVSAIDKMSILVILAEKERCLLNSKTANIAAS